MICISKNKYKRSSLLRRNTTHCNDFQKLFLAFCTVKKKYNALSSK